MGRLPLFTSSLGAVLFVMLVFVLYIYCFVSVHDDVPLAISVGGYETDLETDIDENEMDDEMFV